MTWFSSRPTTEEIKRQAASEFLGCLEIYLSPILACYRNLLETSMYPSNVFSEMGRDLKRHLDEQQDRLQRLSNRTSFAEEQLRLATKDCERLRADPLREQLRKVQRNLDGQTARAEKAEAELVTARRTLAAEQNARQQEVAELRAGIASQNRIIARQQHKLNHLLGEPPDTDLSGD
jgi:chromosome segregation ATPase